MVNKSSSSTLFISDLHLDENHPAIAQRFLQLLRDCGPHIDALYILGDLFEVWAGDDDHSPFNRGIIAAIKAATQKGMPVYFMRGNRDFLTGKQFLRETGCQLLPDEATISLYGTPVLLMHGDTLCTRDKAYIQARKKMRNLFLQSLFLLLPLFIRKKIASQIRQKSMQHTQSAPTDIMDVTQSEVEAVMKKHGTACLIHGHTHQPLIHEFEIDQIKSKRIVLGAWHEKGNMLIWEASGKVEWVEF